MEFAQAAPGGFPGFFMSKWISLAIGSLAGGFARYALAGLAYRVLGAAFPYGTLAVNLSGCFLIGFFNSLAEQKFLLGPNARMLLMIGFCGAFTTFSTLILETSYLAKDGQVLQALANLGASVLLGFIAFHLGVLLGEVL